MTEGHGRDAAPSNPAPPDSQCHSSFWAGSGPRCLALAAITLIGGGVAVLALHSAGPTTPRFRAVDAVATLSQPTSDPLMADLIRCRALPPQASDPVCERAWDENRRRFFGETRAARVPGEPLPPYAPIPSPFSDSAIAPPIAKD